jgi:hypothetical protein
MSGPSPKLVLCDACGQPNHATRQDCWACGALLAAASAGGSAPSRSAPGLDRAPVVGARAPQQGPPRGSSEDDELDFLFAAHHPPPRAHPEQRPRRRFRRRKVVALFGILATVLVAALVIAAVLLFLPRPAAGTTYGYPLAYSQFIVPASSAQRTMPNGPWTPNVAIGLASVESSVVSWADLGAPLGCSTDWSAPASVVMPATPPSTKAGLASAWFLVSSNVGGEVLLSVVTDVTGTVVADNLSIISGSCTTNFTQYGPIPSSVVDSPVVAAKANLDGGTAFLANRTGVAEEYGILGPQWVVLYSTCSFYSPEGSGDQFVALYWASTGAYFSSQNGTAPCANV